MNITCYENNILSCEMNDLLRKYSFVTDIEKPNILLTNFYHLMPNSDYNLQELIETLNQIVIEEYNKINNTDLKARHNFFKIYDYTDYTLQHHKINFTNELGIFICKPDNTRLLNNIECPEGITELKNIEQSIKEKTSDIDKIFKYNNQLIIYSNNFNFTKLTKILAIKISLLFPDNKPKIIKIIQNCFTHLSFNNFTKFNEEIHSSELTNTLNQYYKKIILSTFLYNKENRLKNIKRRIESLNKGILNYQNEILNSINKLKDYNKEYEILKDSNEDFNEIIDYLTNHQYITKTQKYDDNTLLLTIKAPILYYDTDCIDVIVSRMDKKDLVTKILNEVFIKEKYQLWTQCQIRFNTETLEVYPVELHTGNFNYKSKELFAHPHISEFLCMGTHVNEIIKWAKNRDYIGAIEQTIAAVLNFNFTDGYVFDRFKSNLKLRANLPTFKDKENNVYSGYDILERIDKNE